MTVANYHPDGRSAGRATVAPPLWPEVEAAVRRMDGFRYPIVELSCTDHDEDDTGLNVVGGDGGFALFEFSPGWQYHDPTGGDDEIQVWRSDQGYRCPARNVVTDVEKVLRIVRAYYDSGSYDHLDAVT